MSDPLSVIASVLGVTGAALGGSKALYSFITTLKDAPDALRDLGIELSSLNSILEQLKDVLENRDPKNLSQGQTSSLKKTENPLRECENACRGFQRELDKVMSHMKKDGKDSFRDAFKKWFKDATLTGFKGKLDSWKVTLSLELQFVTITSLSKNSVAIEKLTEKLELAMEPLGESLRNVDGRIENLTASFKALEFMDVDMREQMEENLTTQKAAAEEQRQVLEHCVELCNEITRDVRNTTGHTFIGNQAYNDALMVLGDVGNVPLGARQHTIRDSQVRDRARMTGGNMDSESFMAFMGLDVRQKQGGLLGNDEERQEGDNKPMSYYTEDFS
ncbi:hypothetical protein PVAG01_04757 [Phlyctema vagabunda]|uniref:Azaphilone pigments biosynthesis cluster protein L N-terminal domain-containing protein n=1 Tax=Phlyctema vagabunda TaxID=108571 RepID=A0ABR4PI88_9HELO